MYQTKILTIHIAATDLILKDITHFVILRAEHEPARVAVQTMHDTRTIIALNVSEILASIVMNERIGERSSWMSRRRMADESWLLVDHEQIVIFVVDLKRNIFGLEIDMRLFNKLLVDDKVALVHNVFLGGFFAIQEDLARLNLLDRLAARRIQTSFEKIRIETHPGIQIAYRIREFSRHGIRLLFAVFRMLRRGKELDEKCDEHTYDTAGDPRISNIEIREIDEERLDEIDHIATHEPIDHVSQASCEDERKTHCFQHRSFFGHIDHVGQDDRAEHDAHDNEHDHHARERTPCRAEIMNETKANNAIDDRNERSAWRVRFHVGLGYLVANTPKHDHHPEQEIVASCFA